MTNRYMKIYSASLLVREMQIKTTKKYYPTPVKMAIIKKKKKRQKTKHFWKNTEKGKPCPLLVGM